ncbi:MAG: hypothetical protein QOD92_3924 [Acidimicrobiaceae bacterium]|jgi:integrase
MAEATRSKRHFGAIRLLPSGRYQARYPDRTGRYRSAPNTFATKTAAAKYLSTMEGQLNRGEWIDPAAGKICFEDWAQRWWQTTTGLRPSTRARDASYLNSLILPEFGDVALADIDHLAVTSWVAELGTTKSAATVVKAAQILAKALQSAVHSELLRSNPCDRVSLPRVERSEMRFLTPGQVLDLAAAVDPRYRAAVFVAAYGGLRAGELFALRRSRVDLLRGQLDISKTDSNLVEVRGTLHFNRPKTKASQRVVPIPKVVIRELERHLDQLDSVEPNALLFPNSASGPVRLNLWRRRIWIPAAVKAGLGTVTKIDKKREHYEGLRIHDLRHTAVALWIEAGAPPNEIAARAGHTSVVTVLDRYGHLLPGADDRVTTALDRIADDARPTREAHVVDLNSRGTGGH